jgi:hypothetical protein
MLSISTFRNTVFQEVQPPCNVIENIGLSIRVAPLSLPWPGGPNRIIKTRGLVCQHVILVRNYRTGFRLRIAFGRGTMSTVLTLEFACSYNANTLVLESGEIVVC